MLTDSELAEWAAEFGEVLFACMLFSEKFGTPLDRGTVVFAEPPPALLALVDKPDWASSFGVRVKKIRLDVWKAFADTPPAPCVDTIVPLPGPPAPAAPALPPSPPAALPSVVVAPAPTVACSTPSPVARSRVASSTASLAERSRSVPARRDTTTHPDAPAAPHVAEPAQPDLLPPAHRTSDRLRAHFIHDAAAVP